MTHAPFRIEHPTMTTTKAEIYATLQDTPNFFLTLDEDVVYWNTSFSLG